MTNVIVSPVQSRRDRRQFVDFAWELYRGDANWVPPLRANQAQLLGYRRHPFHENAEVQTFLARRNGQVCGRVTAILNHMHNRYYSEKRGFFGFFECIEDQQVAGALFDAVRGWFAERGIRAIRGPANPSMNYECGLLIQGFDSMPTFMMTYNPPYYAKLIEGCGFSKSHDLLAYEGEAGQLPEIEERLGSLKRQAEERSGTTYRSLNRKRFIKDVELFLDLYNRSFVTMWGFVPMSDKEIRHTANSLRRLLIPELFLFAMAEGRAVGVVLALPDYNPRIKQIDGRLFPFGFLKLLSHRERIKKLRVISINVLPEYQRWGVGLALMSELVPPALALGAEVAEFSWISEGNELARMGLEKGGAKITKVYRLYDIEPEAAKSSA